MHAPEKPRRAHFGPFELDLARRELRKYGTRIRLSEQPFQILIALVEAKGEVVTREALQARLWPSNNFGDVDHSLNVAVKRLRDVLCDSASNPRYIATVDRQGYSFIGTMEDEACFRSDSRQLTSNIARSVNPVSAAEVPATERKPAAWSRTRAVAGWVALVMVLLGLATAWRTRFEESPHIVSYVQLTHSGVVHPNQKLLTDGPRLYFIERTHGKWVGKWMSVGGGPATPLNIPFELYDLQDISADGDELLVREFSGWDPTGMQLWTAPTSGGALRHVGGACESAAYSADGRSLLCAAGNSITQTDRAGGNRHRLLEVDGEIYSLSPSHDLLRMAVQESNSGDLTQWEAQNDGSGLRRVLPSWKEARPQPGGAWTSDGRWFAFGAVGNGSRDLWLLDDERHPKQLTSGPLEFRTPTFSRDGKRIFCVGILRRGELLRYDIPNRDAESQITASRPTASSPKFSAMFEGISAEQLEYSPDRKSIVYITYPEQVLWRAKADGSDRRQLTPSGMRVLRPQWSPDGSRIAFETRTSNGTHWSLYMMSSSGGSAHELPVNASGGFAWSHDGRSLIVGDDGRRQMRFLDLEQNTFTNIPGSENLTGPILSPDGAYLAAIQSPGETLVLFDFASHRRRVLGRDAQYPAWSRDGQFIYFNSFAGSAPTMYRVRISDGRIEPLFTLDELVATGSWGYWSSVAPDGSVLFMRDTGNSDIYAVDWQF